MMIELRQAPFFRTRVTTCCCSLSQAALDYDADTAAKYFTVGPPLMVHVDDLGPLSTLWARPPSPSQETILRRRRPFWRFSFPGRIEVLSITQALRLEVGADYLILSMSYQDYRIVR